MKIKKEGQIIELSPEKQYIMFVKAGSILAKEIKRDHTKRRNGKIFFVGDMSEFKFVENSDRITDLVVEDK